MGFQNIWEHNGVGIALTGMVIVFGALTFITIFISVLPGILHVVGTVLPDEDESRIVQGSDSADDEVAAAVGFVLHHVDSQRHRTN